MSAQAGVLYFDGRPIAPDLARRLGAALAAFGPDGGGEHVAPGLVMVSRAQHVTPEDERECQPFVSRRGDVMTWDGRLDNREDLLLQFRRPLGDDRSDVALAMAAFERWDVDGFARLVGDWSLALWDAEARTLHLASDYMGVRALYYAADEKGVRWSSTLSTLVRPIRDISEVDPQFVVGFLTFAMPPEVTPYRDVRSVPAAHVVSWRAGRGEPARQRFWSLSRTRLVDADPQACADELRRLLTDAVRARLRSTRPVWSELSGGLDSSTLVCLAHGLLAQGAAGAPGLPTISYVSDASRESDERPFINAVEAAVGRQGLHLRAEDCTESIDDERGWITPLHLAGTGLEIFRAVRREDGRTLLSGSAGDLFMGNSVDYSVAALDRLVLQHRPLALLGDLRAWSKATQKPIWTLAMALVAHVAPLRCRVPRARWRTLAEHGAKGGTTVEEAACDFFLLQPRCLDFWSAEVERRARRCQNQWSDVPRLPLVEGLAYLSDSRSLQSRSEFPGLRMTFPYAHRPLVEFVLSLPSRVLCAPGRPRALMHDAVDAILPEKVARRFSKGYAAPLIARTSRLFLHGARDRVHSLHLVRGGYVDPSRLARLIDQMSHGACRSLHNVPRIIELERWLDMSRRAPDKRARIPA